MRIGSLVFATTQGLGILAKSFYDAGILTDVLVVHHTSHTNRLDWYPNAKQISSIGDDVAAKEFAREMDVLIFFETPFYWKLIPYCREVNTKTILVPMYECTRFPNPYQADKILCPSHLDLKYYPRGAYIPIPVSVPWRLRTVADKFVHHAGNGSVRSRNGTHELIEAMKLVRTDVRLTLRAQNNWAIKGLPELPSNVELIVENKKYEELWDDGDVFVFPEKWNGLSLPLQEARAAGMLVIATDRFPMNTWLPTAPLVSAAHMRRYRVFGGAPEVEEAQIRPADVAMKLDEWYGRDITEYSQSGLEWAKTMTWDYLRGQYEDFIRS